MRNTLSVNGFNNYAVELITNSNDDGNSVILEISADLSLKPKAMIAGTIVNITENPFRYIIPESNYYNTGTATTSSFAFCFYDDNHERMWSWIQRNNDKNSNLILRKADEQNYRLDAIKTTTAIDKEQILNLVYPVGSVYISANDVSPTTFLGGTWEQLQDRFLLAAGSIYTAGLTGGEASHILTAQEIPKHYHEMLVNNDGSSSMWSPEYGNYLIPASYVTSSKQTYTATLAQNGAGGGQAHNNMPPYLAVYMWKRTG